MVSDWHDLRLQSVWRPAGDAGPAVLRLSLTNEGTTPLEGFRLAVSGPARISDHAPVTGGRIVRRLSNYSEIAPEPAIVLAPGATWSIDVGQLDSPIRHWTDGPRGAFVILADGTAQSVRCDFVRHEGRDAPRRQGTMRLPVEAPSTPGLSIVPWPRTVEVTGRRFPPQGLAIVGTESGASVAAAFARLVATLFPGEALLRAEHEGGLPVTLASKASLGPEAYVLSFAPDGVTINASDDTGQLYGLITLGQMLRGARLQPERYLFPTSGRIADGPEMAWRGCHLDVARRFYARAEVERFVALLAWNKLNRFHWHLSDDEAFRVALDAYPSVTRIAAWRGHGQALPPLLGTGADRYGGVYEKADIRAIVTSAAQWGIEVIPEIDVPGHCYALLEALPQLKDPGEGGTSQSIQSFPNNCLNPGNEAVYPVMETILTELSELFHGRYIHLGADEVPADAWASSPMANALRQKLGATGTAPLQAHFLGRMQQFLSRLGRVTGAWEEAAEGGGIDRKACYLVGWRNVEASQHLASEGYQVVVSPGQTYYMDMANGADWEECGAGWAGWSSPEKAYTFDPAAGWSAAERANLLGVQGAIWSEPMHTPAIFDRLVFPRLSAIAETGWTAPASKDFQRFSAAVRLMPNMYGNWED